MKNNVKGIMELIVAGGLIAGTGFGIYKLVKIGIEADRADKERQEALNKRIDIELITAGYKERIRTASLFNTNLDSHQRNIAYDILNDMYIRAKNSDDDREFDQRLIDLDDIMTIFNSDDKDAMLALLDRRIQSETNKKIIAQREHEIALAKASGEKEIELANIAAKAETKKASLYSDGIKSAATILSEVRNNERDEKSDN